MEQGDTLFRAPLRSQSLLSDSTWSPPVALNKPSMKCEPMQLWICKYTPAKGVSAQWVFFTGIDIQRDGLVHSVGKAGDELVYHTQELWLIKEYFNMEPFLQHEWLVNLSDHNYLRAIELLEGSVKGKTCSNSETWIRSVLESLLEDHILEAKAIERIEVAMDFQLRPSLAKRWLAGLFKKAN